MSVKNVLLEQENERLKEKVEILERAVREIQELIKESAGVYWHYKHPGGRPVGNILVNPWYEIEELTPLHRKAVKYLTDSQQDT